jgi:Phage Terminase
VGSLRRSASAAADRGCGFAGLAGVDASVKRDSTAIVCCAYDYEIRKVRLVWHRIFQPSPDDPLDFENTIETTVLWLSRAFRLEEVRYDPYQMAATAQRLEKADIPMEEFPQTSGNLTAASSNLYELIKFGNLVAYADDALRLAVQRCIAIESSRGWRIAKEKVSDKIDIIIALAQAALGAVESVTGAPPPIEISEEFMRLARQAPARSYAERYRPPRQPGVFF